MKIDLALKKIKEIVPGQEKVGQTGNPDATRVQSILQRNKEVSNSNSRHQNLILKKKHQSHIRKRPS